MLSTPERKCISGPEQNYITAGSPKAPTGGLLLRDKQDEKRIASPENVPETSSVATPSVLALPHWFTGRTAAPFLISKSMLTYVGPVELWATR
jgi:hypothetical protein